MIFAAPGALPTLGFFPSDRRRRGPCARTLRRRDPRLHGRLPLGLRIGAARPARPSRCWARPSVPAFLAFISIRENPALSCLWLAFGYVALQAIDVAFQRAGVAPAYWLTLRLPLTAVVIACLLIGALYG